MQKPIVAMALCTLSVSIVAAGITNPIPDPVPTGPTAVVLQPVFKGLDVPVSLASLDSNRMVVTDLTGVVHLYVNGVQQATPFLDLTGQILQTSGFLGKNIGLSALALHPDFNDPTKPGYQKVYTHFSTQNLTTPDIAVPPSITVGWQNVVSEWSVDPSNPNVIDPNSRRDLLRYDNSMSFSHNAGNLAFGQNGVLYIGVGDASGGHDTLNTGQDPSDVFGSILWIDPFGTNGRNGQYGLVNNPDLPLGALPEIYAYGLRNPWGFSHDSIRGVIIADSGQDNIEEIDIGVPGGNYGWGVKEGTFLLSIDRKSLVADWPGLPEYFIDPIAQYDHDDGISVIGGFVYRGSVFPELLGKYIFGDYGQHLFQLDLDSGEIQRIPFVFSDGTKTGGFSRLGQDGNGELYVFLSSPQQGPGFAFGEGGVYRIAVVPELGSLSLAIVVVAGAAACRFKKRLRPKTPWNTR